MALKSKLGFGMMRLPVKNGDPTAFQKKIDETLHFDEAVTLKDLYNKYAEDFSDLLPIGN